MMPGGDADAYKFIEPIVTKVAAQVQSPAVAVPESRRTPLASASLL